MNCVYVKLFYSTRGFRVLPMDMLSCGQSSPLSVLTGNTSFQNLDESQSLFYYTASVCPNVCSATVALKKKKKKRKQSAN